MDFSEAYCKNVDPDNYHEYVLLFLFSIQLSKPAEGGETEKVYGWYGHQIFDRETKKLRVGNFSE